MRWGQHWILLCPWPGRPRSHHLCPQGTQKLETHTQRKRAREIHDSEDGNQVYGDTGEVVMSPGGTVIGKRAVEKWDAMNVKCKRERRKRCTAEGTGMTLHP